MHGHTRYRGSKEASHNFSRAINAGSLFGIINVPPGIVDFRPDLTNLICGGHGNTVSGARATQQVQRADRTINRF